MVARLGHEKDRALEIDSTVLDDSATSQANGTQLLAGLRVVSIKWVAVSKK
jgi:hypothetical protein